MEATVSRPAADATGTRLLDRLTRVAASAPFAYGSILAIQAKVLWGIWNYRDLTPGDTAAYFVAANQWADHLRVSAVFYPLYHVLWGSLMWIVSDPYAVTILHRILIAIGTTLLLLAVLRRLLTPVIAWGLALWWAILPINYDVLYEIHLFGALAGLAIAWVALRWSGLAARSVVFGLLLASALLVRNENIVAAFVFGLVWVGYEIWRMRKGTAPPARRLGAAAVIPIVAVAALLGLSAWRDTGDHSVFSEFSRKHEVNICQVYAQGRWQSGDMLAANPHAQCFEYTLRDFGVKFPSLLQAIEKNPGAMGRHFLTNAGLVPAGLEIDLFNAKYGSVSEASNPDYIPVHRGSWLVLGGSILVLVVLGTGAVLLWRERRRWWDEWIRERVWGWAAMAAMGTSALYAALLTRPRPSYMFPLSALIFACIGMSLVVIASRLRVPKRALAVIPPLAIAALLLVPVHYRQGYANPQIGPGQRLKEAVSRIEPFRDQIAGAQHGLLAEYPTPMVCEYASGSDPCSPISWNNPVAETLGPELAGRDQQSFSSHSVDFIYADETVFREDPTIRARLAQLERSGWHRLAPASAGSDWALLARDSQPAASSSP